MIEQAFNLDVFLDRIANQVLRTGFTCVRSPELLMALQRVSPIALKSAAERRRIRIRRNWQGDELWVSRVGDRLCWS